MLHLIGWLLIPAAQAVPLECEVINGMRARLPEEQVIREIYQLGVRPSELPCLERSGVSPQILQAARETPPAEAGTHPLPPQLLPVAPHHAVRSDRLSGARSGFGLDTDRRTDARSLPGADSRHGSGSFPGCDS